MKLMRDEAERPTAFSPETPGEAILEAFGREPDRLLAAVADADGRPLGLVERHSFFLKMASQYGRAIYARRPVSLLMDTDFLVVDANREVSDFTAAVLSARASDLLRGFIVVEDGRYFGVGSPLLLLKAVNDEALRISRDLSVAADDLRLAKREIERDKLFTETVIENIPAMLFVKSVEDDRFVLVNRAAEEALGYSREELLGKNAVEVFSTEQAAQIVAEDRALLASGGVRVNTEECVRRKSGEERRFSTRKLAVADETGAHRWILCVSEDVTDRRADQAQIERLAHYDTLTGLPNRVLFQRRLEEGLAAATVEDTGTAVFCVDLDHFKAVNDTLGHAAGDTLLALVATRLRSCLRAEDSVGRLGGDEFAVVQTGVDTPEVARRLAARMVQVLSEPYDIDGQQAVIGASVGFALHPVDGIDPGELLQRADMALYRAKANGRGRHQAFAPHMDAELQARRQLEVALRRALKQGELLLHFQPLTSLKDDRITGCEALVRWADAERGLVPPGEFIALAEEIGLIGPLGEWVLRAACEEAARWPSDMTLAVNVSPIQFRDRRLPRMVAQALAAAGLPAHRLELEITENVLLADDAANMAVLHQLKSLGCRIALDDFGTGYSSLSYLRSFPFDKIKIDRSFVSGLPHDAGSTAIIRTVTSLAGSLGMTTTAEGVETVEQLEALRTMGCDQVQGYLISRPIPDLEIRLLLERDRRQVPRVA